MHCRTRQHAARRGGIEVDCERPYVQVRRTPFHLSILGPHIMRAQRFGSGGDDMRQDVCAVCSMSIVEGSRRFQNRVTARGRGRGRGNRRGAFGRLKARHHRPGGRGEEDCAARAAGRFCCVLLSVSRGATGFGLEWRIAADPSGPGSKFWTALPVRCVFSASGGCGPCVPPSIQGFFRALISSAAPERAASAFVAGRLFFFFCLDCEVQSLGGPIGPFLAPVELKCPCFKRHQFSNPNGTHPSRRLSTFVPWYIPTLIKPTISVIRNYLTSISFCTEVVQYSTPHSGPTQPFTLPCPPRFSADAPTTSRDQPDPTVTGYA